MKSGDQRERSGVEGVGEAVRRSQIGDVSKAETAGLADELDWRRARRRTSRIIPSN